MTTFSALYNIYLECLNQGVQNCQAEANIGNFNGQKFTNCRVPFPLQSMLNFRCSLTRDFMAATLILEKGYPKFLNKWFSKGILSLIVA